MMNCCMLNYRTNIVFVQEAENCRSQILEVKGPACPVVVVLNKTDLIRSGSVSSEPTADDEKNDRAVGGSNDGNFLCQEMVESLVTCDWGHGFVSASAKTNINVVQVTRDLWVHALLPRQVNTITHAFPFSGPCKICLFLGYL